MPTKYYIAFWNLENLFDIENSPRRNDKLERAIKSDMAGWTQAVLDTKISQLASVITRMNRGNGPDILGVCEVENDYVMNLLAQSLTPKRRSYKVIHHDSPDQRGIDVAFIYDADLFTAGKPFDHFVMRRTATRDLLQVDFKTRKNNLLVIVGNHWPSRSGGSPGDSAAYRAMAGETLAYFHERIIETNQPNTPVLALGDFNDEPFDLSLTEFALATRSMPKVLNAAKNYYFYNLMWPLMGKGLGTLYFDGPNVYDQILVNKNMLEATATIRVLPDTVEIFTLPEMAVSSRNPEPKRFGGMEKALNKKGFSDHFPVAVNIEEA